MPYSGNTFGGSFGATPWMPKPKPPKKPSPWAQFGMQGGMPDFAGEGPDLPWLPGQGNPIGSGDSGSTTPLPLNPLDNLNELLAQMRAAAPGWPGAGGGGGGTVGAGGGTNALSSMLDEIMGGGANAASALGGNGFGTDAIDIPSGTEPPPEDKVVTGTGEATATGNAPWDFWATLAGILGGTYEPGQIEALRSSFGAAGMGWRQPRQAQQMLTLASALKAGFGTEGEDFANQLAMAALMQGFQQPSWNLSGMLGPLLQRWGLSRGG